MALTHPNPSLSRFRRRGRGRRTPAQASFAFSPAETDLRVSHWGEPDGSPYKTCRRGGACGSGNGSRKPFRRDSPILPWCSCARSAPLPSPIFGRGKRGRPPQAAGVMGEVKRQSQPPRPDELIPLLLNATNHFVFPPGESEAIKARKRPWEPSRSIQGLRCGLPRADKASRKAG